MIDIKQRLLDAADESPEYRDMCTVARDHIAAQEKRIAELEAQIAEQSWQNPFAWIDECGQLVVFEKFIKHIGFVREDGAIPDSWHPIFKRPAPADAIDAERLDFVINNRCVVECRDAMSGPYFYLYFVDDESNQIANFESPRAAIDAAMRAAK